MTTLNATAILLAGGSGNRMQGSVPDKILAPLANKPVIRHSIDAFLASDAINAFVVVCRDDAQQAAIQQLLPSGSLTERSDTSASRKTPPPTPSVSTIFARGGPERQDSVWAGLQAAPETTEIVLIHDCARPCVTPEAIRESIAAAHRIGAACLARRVTDTIKSADAYDDAYLPTTVERSKLWAMETPQTFRFSLIRDAYQSVIRSGARITDDLSAIETLDQPVAFIENARPNPKLTTPSDFAYLEFLLTQRSSESYEL